MTSYTTKTLAARLITSVLGPQPLIPIHRPFLELTGDYTAAAFLAQAMYLSDRLSDDDGWFDYTTEQWEADLQISRERLRRCQRLCSDYVTIERRGIPCRNFFRIDEEALTEALAKLKTEESPSGGGGSKSQPSKQKKPQPAAGTAARQLPESESASGSETMCTLPLSPLEKKQEQIDERCLRKQDVTGEPSVPSSSLPTNSVGTPSRSDDVRTSVARSRPRDDVRRPLRTSETTFQRLLETYNTHRGRLPAAGSLTAARRRSLEQHLEDCHHDTERAMTQLEQATREVAQDDFWFQKRLGFDTLLAGKVAGKAEAWLSRQPRSKAPTRDDVAKPDFEVGARVLYQREGYTVEELTATYVELYDEENGSVRVLRSSPAWTMLRRLEQTHG